MSTYLQHKYNLFAKIGSFWHKMLGTGKDINLARTLSLLPNKSSAVSQMANIPLRVNGLNTGTYTYTTLPTNKLEMVTIGAELLNTRKATDLITTENRILTVTRLDANSANFDNLTTLSTELGGEIISTENYKYLLFPCATSGSSSELVFANSQVYYLLPIPFGNRPTIISTKTRDLFVGTDFAVVEGA